MSVPNDIIETAIPLPASPFPSGLSNADANYSGWGKDVFYKFTAPSNGHIAVWLLYAEDPQIYLNTVGIWRTPLSATTYINFDQPANFQDFDDGDRYGGMIDVSVGETIIISVTAYFDAVTPFNYTVEWGFNPSPTINVGASGGTAAMIVGQQLNGASPIDRTWRFNAIVRDGAETSVAAVTDFTLTRDTFQADHSGTRIDDNRILWYYDAPPDGVYARVITFDGAQISVGPETFVSVNDIDNAEAACCDGSVVFFSLRGSSSQENSTYRVNSDGTLTLLDSVVESVSGSYDRSCIAAGSGQALTWEYVYNGTQPGQGRYLRRVTWDATGELVIGNRISIPAPPYRFDYYQSFLDYVDGVVYLCESWDVLGQQNLLGIRAINPVSMEVGPLSDPIVMDYDNFVTQSAYYEIMEAARQYTQVGYFADGVLGVIFPRWKKDAYRTLQHVAIPITVDTDLNVTTSPDDVRLFFEGMGDNEEQNTHTFYEESYLSERFGYLFYGLALSWWSDSIDTYHHIVAQSLSSTAGENYVTVDLDANTHFTWWAAPLYGSVYAPPNIAGDFLSGRRRFAEGR